MIYLRLDYYLVCLVLVRFMIMSLDMVEGGNCCSFTHGLFRYSWMIHLRLDLFSLLSFGSFHNNVFRYG